MFLQTDSEAVDPAVPAQNGHSAVTLGGSNHDVVANRKAIRMANMSAAEALKAEMAGLKTLGRNAEQPAAPPPVTEQPTDTVMPAADAHQAQDEVMTVAETMMSPTPEADVMSTRSASGAVAADSPRGVKRKVEDVAVEDDEVDAVGEDDVEEDEQSDDAAPEVIGAVVVRKSKTEEHDDIQ